MPWSSSTFIDLLSSERLAPVHYLESIPMGWTYSGGHPLGGLVKFSSGPAEGYIHCIRPQDSSIRHARLSPGDWTRSHGSMTIQTTLSAGFVADVEQVQRCIRGQYWRLRVELAPGAVETVWVGVLRNVRWSMKGGYVLEFVELVGGLTSRNTRDGTRVGLFSGLSTTTVAAGTPYTAADATLTVTDGSAFEKESGGVHLIRVTPTAGPPFYMTASRSGNVFTRVAVGIFDTLDANAAAGQLVEEIAYIPRHPVLAALRVLTSTGLGTNGASDLLPEQWGMGIAADLVDAGDMSTVQADLASSAYVAYARVDAEEPDGLSWLAGYLQPFGLFLAQRQGQLTVRAVRSLATPDAIVTDHDIASGGLEYDAWDPDSPVEYAVWRTTIGTLTETDEFTGDATSDITDESTVSTAPVRHLREWSLPDVFRADLDLGTTADAQVTAWTADVPVRLWRWATRPPERVSMRLARWTTAGLCLGDTLELRSEIVQSRYDGPFGFSSGRRGLIVGGGPDWFRGGCPWEVLFQVDFDEAGV